MTSVRIAVILSVLFLPLLSHANSLHHVAEDSIVVDPVARDEQGDAKSTILVVDPVARDEPEDAKSTILVSPVDTKETATVVSLPDLFEGFDHVDISLRRPFHNHHHRHRHHHPIHVGEVVPYGDDMIHETRNVELDGGLKKEEKTAAVAADVELVKLPEGGGESGVSEELKHWHNEVPEWKEAAEKGCKRRRNKKEHKKNRDKEDSDSDSDDDEVEIKIVKKRPRKMKKKEKESGGWLKWFWSFWE